MQSKILMTGLTASPIASLLPIAKSWVAPASLEVVGKDFRSDGFDLAQRAFVLPVHYNELVDVGLEMEASFPAHAATIGTCCSRNFQTQTCSNFSI